MKKAIFFIAALCLIWFAQPVLAADIEIEQGVGDILDGTDLSSWQEVFDALPEDVQNIWGDTEIEALITGSATRESAYFGGALLTGIASLFAGEIPKTLELMLQLLAIALLSGFIKALAEGHPKGVQDVASLVCHCFAVIVALYHFLSLVSVGREAITATASFIELSFPVLLTLLTAAGGIASAGIFQPAMTLLCSSIAFVLRDVVVALVLMGAVMAVLNAMTGRVQLGQLYALSKSSSKWIIGLMSTLYFGITSLQGMTSAVFDGVSVRTAKYALDRLIPIVGSVVSGSVDTVLGCALLVKNAAGVAAILIAFSIVLSPLLRIGLGIFAFRIVAALTEPVADARMTKMLSSLADVLTYLFAAAMTLSVMFMITVGLLMRTGSLVVTGG